MGGAELLVLAGPEEELVVAPVMDMLLSTRDSRSQRTERKRECNTKIRKRGASSN